LCRIFVFQTYESKQESIRRGRPRSRWLEDVQKDLWEIKVKIWRRKAVDREEWAFVFSGRESQRAVERENR